MKESNLQRNIQIALTSTMVKLFRNNVGVLRNERGNYVKYGIANPGGSDLLGWKTIIVTNDMIGKKIAVFVAIEVKKRGYKATEAQLNFINAVINAGGIASICHSVDEALSVLR